jgi:hypothetical protein
MITSVEYFCSVETLEITMYLRGAWGRLALPPMKVSLFLNTFISYYMVYIHIFTLGTFQRDFCGRAVAC